MWQRLFQRWRRSTELQSLYDAVVASARDPKLFGPNGIPDTMDGRFEVLAAHAAVAVHALRGQEHAAGAARFVDLMFEDLDAALRETGVGDHQIARRTRALGAAFAGRAMAYGDAFAALDEERLASALRRNFAHLEEAAHLDAVAARLSARLVALRRAAGNGSGSVLDAFRSINRETE